MKMNDINCNVIKDLIPLYIDDAVSPETKELVEIHIYECPACREELENMKKVLPLPVCRDLEQETAGIIKSIRLQLQRKKVRAAIISSLAAVALIIGLYAVMVFPSRVIPYEEGLVSVREDGEDVWIRFTGRSYNCSYGLDITEIEIDGKKKNAIAIYYDETLYSKYLEPVLHPNHTYDDEWLLNDLYYTENDDGEMERVEQQLDVIYYSSIKINSREITEQDWTDHIDDMEIIWERKTQ